jgi:hypothetical protein
MKMLYFLLLWVIFALSWIRNQPTKNPTRIRIHNTEFSRVEDVCVVGFPEGNYTGHAGHALWGAGGKRQACLVFRYILLYFQSGGRVRGGIPRRELHRTDHALGSGGNEAGMLSIQIYSIIFPEWRTCAWWDSQKGTTQDRSRPMGSGGNEAGMLSIQIYSIIFPEWRTCAWWGFLKGTTQGRSRSMGSAMVGVK